VCVRVPAARFARGFANSLSLLEEEGAGNAGCTLHPRSRVPRTAHLAHTSIQVSGNTPTSPAQWLYGLYRALPGERACCHRHQRDTSRQLSASIAAPGPHDFAVRLRSFVRARAPEQKRPSHPIPTFSDDGRRPSSGIRPCSSNSDFQKCQAEYFSFWGLTRFLKIRSDLPVG
jgi:hypothetical protein